MNEGISEGPLPLVSTSERAKRWIAGGEPLFWKRLLDGVSFDNGYAVRTLINDYSAETK